MIQLHVLNIYRFLNIYIFYFFLVFFNKNFFGMLILAIFKFTMDSFINYKLCDNNCI